MNKCIYCSTSNSTSGVSDKLVKFGRYRRKSDCKWVQKFFCQSCRKYFSSASLTPTVGQNKRQINYRLGLLLSSGVSQRRAAKILKITRHTVAKKLIFLGALAEQKLLHLNTKAKACEVVEFDDLETFEHTKCKPLSITLAVESESRRILGFEVSQMPAKGNLVPLALKKYGPRPDLRALGREKLFSKIKPLVLENAIFKSDQNPHYPKQLKKHFPKCQHLAFKGQRGSIVGQGELKKIRFDPLFSLNHTCAMFRANVNRLFRKTWCTTKIPEKLSLHLSIYALYHNLSLPSSA